MNTAEAGTKNMIKDLLISVTYNGVVFRAAVDTSYPDMASVPLGIESVLNTARDFLKQFAEICFLYSESTHIWEEILGKKREEVITFHYRRVSMGCRRFKLMPKFLFIFQSYTANKVDTSLKYGYPFLMDVEIVSDRNGDPLHISVLGEAARGQRGGHKTSGSTFRRLYG